MFSKRLLTGAALTALSVSMGGAAYAQSTASQLEDEVIVVTGARASLAGTIVAEQAPKARATITDEYIATQGSGQTILNTINVIPGVNFVNTDPYGSSGGSLTMRGFDGNRISLTFDGIPLNDTGNYAIYSNQQLDPELIQRANVNLGTTDVDSPTAAATGGTVNYISRIPSEEAGLDLSAAIGSFNFRRVFGYAETGALGGWGTRLFGAASWTEYDQFIGPGELQKWQVNGGLYQPLGDNGDFFRLSFHYNQNRNDFYYRFSQVQYAAGFRENIATCSPLVGVNGTAQNSANDGCTASNFRVFQGHSINPSNTGNIRGQSRFTLTDALTLTVDPTFQYVRANGGGTLVFSETSPQLIGGTGRPGVDLNFDGDFLDSVRLYSPSNTNTYRYGVTSSLIWDINDHHRIRFGYTWDYGRHRQTGEFGYLRRDGDPEDVFGGRDGFGRPVLNGRGEVFQKRDRLSIASLEQFSVEYRGDFLNDALTVVFGVRAPMFERELNQNCYSVRGSSSSTQYCTTQTPTIIQPDGFVRFTAGGTQYAPPFAATVEYEEVLPNLGISFRPAEGHQIFASYAEGLSAPRTDDLYGGITVRQLPTVQPETTSAYDLGYRYQGAGVMAQATVWYNQFENRIERSADPTDPTLFFSRNVGSVDLWGFEAAVGWQATERLFTYGALAWTDSELAIGGFSVVETPDLTLTARAEYDAGMFTIGAQARYVGERFANDANTEVAPDYTTLDLDARVDLPTPFGGDQTYLQLNVINVFDEEYFGQLSASSGTSAGLYNLGPPQTVMLTLRSQF